MTRAVIVATLVVLLGLIIGCGPESMEDNPSCCFYECLGDREQYFSMYFGSEAECRQLSESRCAAEFEAQPGLRRFEFQGQVEFDMQTGLNATCEMRFLATFTSTGA